MRSMWILALLTLCLNVSLLPQQIEGVRSKRFLIFPRQAPTRHQFIAGIGIPADLTYESLTVGHVLKAMFYLPYNATVYRENPYLPEYRRNSTLNNNTDERKFYEKPSNIRWQIYEYIEHILNGYGCNGHQCLLKAICEANSVKFSKDFSVVAELMHLLLSPSSTLNDNEDESKSRVYIAAEEAAADAKGADCEMFDCKISLLDWISRVMQLEY
ncbi:uncharacterized protein Dwil_GK10625 [Drosophila willistoni]|uniref:Uncharacterized protein n=1 Tax=Drosophila willistoni TaxID=7260 RepID=B4MJ00_DROWI|nr:uncharacterized protein LOC6637909 [Drosophila willistoni]EDW72089.2 uncharacterized protein Dwil_GK10625 [Drosophila willistoni]